MLVTGKEIFRLFTSVKLWERSGDKVIGDKREMTYKHLYHFHISLVNVHHTRLDDDDICIFCPFFISLSFSGSLCQQNSQVYGWGGEKHYIYISSHTFFKWLVVFGQPTNQTHMFYQCNQSPHIIHWNLLLCSNIQPILVPQILNEILV